MHAPHDDPELEARVRARVGTTLRGKYRLDDVLGIGGMAAVYSATHRNGRRVAVKLLHPEVALSSEAKTRFLREGLVANTVRHPGVVTILDDDTNEDGAAFLVMELLTGSTLDELWERHGHRLPLPAVIAACIMLLDILSAAHAAGVVHRDIKPANLFLTERWELKILDFGISRLQNTTSATATQTGMMMGSPAFMSPEQALGRSTEIDGRTDLWSAAASVFTLASGEFVHEGQSGQEMLIRAATTPVRSLAAAMPAAPALIVAVIDRALAFGKTERWGTASEMGVALSEAARASFGEEPSAGTFATMVPFLPPTGTLTPGFPMHISSMPPPIATGPGMTQLTSSTSAFIEAAESRRRKRALILGGVGLLGAVMALAIVVGRASRRSESGAASGSDVRGATPGATRGSRGVEGPAGGETSFAAPTNPPFASGAPSEVDISALPVAPLNAPARAGVPPSQPPAPSPPSPLRTTPKAAPAPRAPAKPTKPSSFIPPSSAATPPPAPADPCNPPYRYDFFGNKVAKAGCSL